VQQALAQADRHGRKLAVLFIDLDGFKAINDLHGHDTGDAVLAELARRLHRTMRESDTLGRLGGDEFVVLIESYSDDVQLPEVARKVLDSVSQPIEVHGDTHQVTASVGIAAYPLDGHDVQELINRADSAMYRAKQAGRNRFEFHASALSARFPSAPGP
jgi:diguanylate cyclase (GGDEF)-like protein